MSKCRHTQYVYNASAYGFAAELERPAKHSIPAQAASVLPASGGRGNARVHDFKFDGIISVKDAYSEVGGSFDEDHDLHTSYAFAVLDGVNVADVLTADRVVSRVTIYASEAAGVEPQFSISGSHFENLKIAGHQFDIKLATDEFHNLQTYSEIDGKSAIKWQSGSKLGELKEKELEALEDDYHGLSKMAALVKASKPNGKGQNGAGYLLSPANHPDLTYGVSSEILVYGNIIFIPKFGLIRLAEMVVHKYSRVLTMFRVQMCSAGSGSSDGGGAGGGGGMGAP